LDAFPTISLQDLNVTLGPDPVVPSGTIQDELQVAENFTKMWRRHTFKIGYEIRDIILSSATVSFPRGNYKYANLNEYLQDFAPSLGGQRTLGANGPILNGIPVGFLQNAAYFNDDFRVRSNLTLNLGVRYEFVTVPVAARAQKYSAAFSVPGVITFGEPQPTKNDWSPRIGFTYSPGSGGIWSIRGGFSRAFDMPYANIASNTLPTFYGAVKNSTPGTSNFLASGGLNTTLTPGVTTYSPDQKRPYAISYTFSVQRLLGKDYTIEARYLGTRGVHLLVQEQINRVGVVTPTRSIPVFFSTPTPAQLAALPYTVGDLRSSNNPLAAYPGLGSAITAYLPVGNSKYNGLALQLTKRYSKSLSYIAAYTWSHALDDSTATVSTTVLTPRRPQDPLNLRAEWASSMLDRRHRFTMTPIYDFTPFQHSRWFFKNVVGNWNVAFTYTFESPEYATVQSNIDSNLSGDAVGDRAIVNPSGIAKVGSGVTAYDRSGKVISLANSTPANTNGIAAYVVINPNARYILAGPGAYANGGRNTFPLAPINNFDASLRKGFNLGETKRFEIGAQFYNLLNHPQYVAGYISDVAPLKTTALSFSNFLTPGNSTFGQYQQVFPSNSRWVQLVARFTF
jgi:hypothetical protein